MARKPAKKAPPATISEGQAFTALCIWENVIEAMRDKGRQAKAEARAVLADAGVPIPTEMAGDGLDNLVSRVDDRDGWFEGRLYVINTLAAEIDAVWSTVQKAVPDYDGLECFDFEFVPAFLARCIDDDGDTSPIAEERMIDYALEQVAKATARKATA